METRKQTAFCLRDWPVTCLGTSEGLCVRRPAIRAQFPEKYNQTVGCSLLHTLLLSTAATADSRKPACLIPVRLVSTVSDGSRMCDLRGDLNMQPDFIN